jgi:hypothetical protein
MGKKNCTTCNDCYFRQAGLCALPGEQVCPTFRMVQAGTFAPLPQPRLVPGGLAVAHAAA